MVNIHKTILLLQMKKWLNSDYLIVDTEITGLEDHDEIIEISIINMSGDVLLDTLVKPTRPIPAEATAINNITDEMVANAPSWLEVYPLVISVLSNHKWLAWNSKFDARMITQTSLLTGLYDGLDPEVMLKMFQHIHSGHIDAKVTYSQWYGELSTENGGFVRQSLSMAVSQQNVISNANAHRALADCQSILKVLHNACENESSFQLNDKELILELLLAENIQLKSSRETLAKNVLESCNEIFCAGYQNAALQRGFMESTGDRNRYPKPIGTMVDEAIKTIKTPATEASLAAIFAQNVINFVPSDEFLTELIRASNRGGSPEEYRSAMRDVFAQQLRKEVAPIVMKLPSLKQTDSGERYVWSDGVYNFKQDVIVLLRANGITVQEDE